MPRVMGPRTCKPMKNGSTSGQNQGDHNDAARVAWIYALSAAAWILLSDWMLDRYSGDATLGAQLGTLKGWLFVVVTAAILYALLRYRRNGNAQSSTRRPDNFASSLAPKSPALQMAIAIVAIVTVTVATIYFRYSEVEQREAARIEAIADSRAVEVAAWLRHRMAETEFVRSSPLMAELYGKWRKSGDKTSLQRLRERATEYRKANEYESAIVSDEHGETIARDNDTVSRGASAELKTAVLRALATGRTQRTPVYYRAGAPAASRIDFVIPLVGGGSVAHGTITLRIDATEFLFPLLERWPVATTSAETLLVSRAGDKITFVSPLRFRNDGPGTYTTENSALLAVRGATECQSKSPAIHAIDYRGVEVMGTVRPVAGSDWLIIAKIDHSEIVAAMLSDAAWIALAGLIAIIAACAMGASHRARIALQIAAVRHAEQAEQLQTLQLLNAIADASTDAIFAKDVDGRYLLFNREACRITGKQAGEVLGKDDSALFPPAQAEKMKRENMAVLVDGKTTTFEETLTTVNGERVYLSTKGPLRDANGIVTGTFGIAHDITRRKHDEIALSDAATMLQSIQNSITNQMVVLDRNGVIVTVNKAWEDFAKENSPGAGVIPANTGITANYLDICANASGEFSDEAAAACDGIRRILAGEHEGFELEYPCHAPFEKRWFLMNAAPLKSGVGGAVVVHTNITARKRVEMAKQEQTRILEMVTGNVPILQTLGAIARSIEFLADDKICSILLIDETGTHLKHAAAPSLPAAYNQAIDGIAIGPGVGCCGTAAYIRAEVVVADILTHPFWRDFVSLAKPIGLRSCWSTPIFNAKNDVVGTFAMYGRVPGEPSTCDRQFVDLATHLASICIDSSRARAALELSENRYHSMVNALTEGIVMFDGSGRVVACNPAAEKIFSTSEKQLVEQFRSPSDWPETVDENGRPVRHEDRAISQAIATGETQRGRIRGQKLPDGSMRWRIVNAEPLRDAGERVSGVIASYTDITERFRVEQEMRKLSLAVEQSFNSIIITNADARIEFVNDAFCRVSGYSRDELLGRNPRLLKSGKTPDATYRTMWATLTAGHAWKGEFTNRHKDGNEFTEIVHISPIRQSDGRITHYLGIREDITERKRISEELDRHRHHLEELVVERTQALETANAALRQSENFVKAITNNVPGLVSYWDRDMRCRFANKAYFEWWGKTPDEMLGRTVQEIVAPGELFKYEPRMAAALRGEPQHMERSHPLPGGRTGYTWAHYIPETENGSVIGFYVLGTDITAVKEAELQLRKLNDEISLARDLLQQNNTDLANEVEQRRRAEDEARQLNQILDSRKQALERLAKNLETFSYSVSHDLRAPLRAISGYAEMLCEAEAAKLSDEGRHMLERVIAGARKMDRLIKDILEYSRVERLKRKDSVIDMAALAKQIGEDQLVAHPQAQFVLGDLPKITAEATMVQQILSNLIGNAFKFSAKRADARIEIGAVNVNGTPEFFVRDNGVGFNQKYSGKLFNLFQRMHSESEFAGTGVGLAVVKRLIEHHGGRVSAESVPDEQTTFRFTLAPDSVATAA